VPGAPGVVEDGDDGDEGDSAAGDRMKEHAQRRLAAASKEKAKKLERMPR
jgi:hypothetical protein